MGSFNGSALELGPFQHNSEVVKSFFFHFLSINCFRIVDSWKKRTQTFQFGIKMMKLYSSSRRHSNAQKVVKVLFAWETFWCEKLQSKMTRDIIVVAVLAVKPQPPSINKIQVRSNRPPPLDYPPSKPLNKTPQTTVWFSAAWCIINAH